MSAPSQNCQAYSGAKVKIMFSPRGFAPRTPLHALSRGPLGPRSVRVARSLRSLAERLYEIGSCYASHQREAALGQEDQRGRPDQPWPQREAPLGLASAWRVRIERAHRSRRASGISFAWMNGNAIPRRFGLLRRRQREERRPWTPLEDPARGVQEYGR